MASLTLRKHLAAPRDRVFDAAVDIRNSAGRISGIKRVHMLTEGPTRVGTRCERTRTHQAREMTEALEVVALDRPARAAFLCRSATASCTAAYTFLAVGEETEVEITLDVRPITLVARMTTFVTNAALHACQRVIEQDLEDLRHFVEGKPAVALA